MLTTTVLGLFGPVIESLAGLHGRFFELESNGGYCERRALSLEIDVNVLYVVPAIPPPLSDAEITKLHRRASQIDRNEGGIVDYFSGVDFSSRTTTLVYSGWPMHAFRGITSTFVANPTAGTAPVVTTRDLLSIGQTARGPIYLPFAPVWPGLLADTLLFTTAAWFTQLVWRAGINARHRRRNTCCACGYSRAGLQDRDPCPECGTGAIKGKSGK